MYTPYTYYLYHKPTGLRYYGGRWINSKRGIAHPSDLWVTYFSSSKKVHELIEQYGLDSFVCQVRKTFNTAEETKSWEKRFLKKVKACRNVEWLNITNGQPPVRVGPVGDETRTRMSIARKGIVYSDETKKKMSLAKLGKPSKKKCFNVTQETKDKISKTLTGYKHNTESKENMRRAPKNISGMQSVESRKKTADKLRGRPQSDEHKKKNSDAIKEWWRKRKEDQILSL